MCLMFLSGGLNEFRPAIIIISFECLVPGECSNIGIQGVPTNNISVPIIICTVALDVGLDRLIGALLGCQCKLFNLNIQFPWMLGMCSGVNNVLDGCHQLDGVELDGSVEVW